MPQFDTSIFLSEIFWLFIIFFIFYFLIALIFKFFLFRIFFFRKSWLNFFINFSKNLNKNLFIFSRCYYENIYFNFFKKKKNLISPDILLKKDILNFEINKNLFFHFRKNIHIILNKFFY